jgi:ribosomal-protein-alanine N-acetyltransferase
VLCRPYTPADFEAIYALEELCFKPPFRFSRHMMHALVTSRNAAIWTAESAAVLTGFGIVTWVRHRGAITAYVETLEVAPSERGGGVGRALLERLEAAAEEAGASGIGLHVDALNAAAIGLYEAAGYACLGRRENFYPEHRAALLYAKDLNPSPLQSTSH